VAGWRKRASRGARVALGPLAALVALVVLWAAPAFALEPPKLAGRVSDYANVIPDDVERRITGQLEAYERSTGHQFAVLTIPGLEGDPIEDFSIRVVEAWKLGSEKEDDGLLLLVVPGDRKVRVEVGYGLEGDIPDALASRVVRAVLTPAFKSGDFAGGIERALAVLMKAGGGEAVELPAEPRRERSGGFPPLLFALFFLLPFAIPLFAARRFGRRGLGRGLYMGGLGGGFGGYRGSSGGGFSGGFSGGGGGFGGGGASGSW